MKRRPRKGRPRLRRGIYLLPSLFTTGNLFFGYASVIATLGGDFRLAAVAVLIGAVLDVLDGRIARMTNSQTEFGNVYDSLADLVTFGIAPAALMYAWGVSDLGRFGWLVGFVYVACTATRLARFSVQTGSGDYRYFVGLPSPAAATSLAALAFFSPEPVTSRIAMTGVLALVVIVSVLMVSKVRYHSIKSVDLRQRQPYPLVVLVALAIALFALDPQFVFLFLASVYVASGPIDRLVRWSRRPKGAATSVPDPATASEANTTESEGS